MTKTKKQLIISLAVLVLGITTISSNVVSTIAADSWTLVNDARQMKGYSDLREYVWQKTPSALPNGQYDKIGLHRLVKPGISTTGVVFMVPQFASSGEVYISNPPTDNWTKLENFTQSIYWANRGFDVYAMDCRTHFVPNSLNVSQLSFMKDWSLDMFVSDIKEAVNKVKEVSGASKIFILGSSQSAGPVINYATKYWRDDLRGIILESPYLSPVTNPVVAKRGSETNTYNLTQQLNMMASTGAWATENAQMSNIQMMKYAFENPAAAAEYPPGTSLTPTVNPATNRSWTSITERNSYYYSIMQPASNILGGYGNVTLLEYYFSTFDRWIPARIALESSAMVDWRNCPYLSYDYDDHYAEIDVPLIAFRGQYSTNTSYVNGMATSDFTGIFVPKSGQYDIFFGTYSSRDVSQPILNWMINHYQPPAASTFSSVTVFAGQTWYFCVHSNGGVSPHKYQWYEGTTPIAGQTSMVLAASKAAPGTYTYYCRVTDAEGSTAISTPVTLTVR